MIIRENDEVNDQPEEVVLDHLHATAFQGHSLGYSILGPLENIKTITKKDLRDYIDKNYTAPRIVLAAAGGIEHEAVVDIAEKYVRLRVAHASCRSISCFVHCLESLWQTAFSTIPFAHECIPRAPVSSNTRYFGNLSSEHNAQDMTPAGFVGSEIRARDDDKPYLHLGMAVEGCGWTNPDYFPLMVASTMVGSWDRSYSGAENMSSKLARQCGEFDLATKCVDHAASLSL